MIYITNPLVLPLVVLIWSVDAWLWLASIRLILGKIVPDNTFCNAIKRLTDTLPDHINQLTYRWTKIPLPIWAPWLITVFGLMTLRHILLQIILSMRN